jgi:large subunit ribosomal protein L4
MKLKVYKTDGSETGQELDLNEDIFGIEPNDTVIYEDVRAYLAHQRQGTAKTKGRSDVRGGGRKAYRQKGTGNARRGTIRSPLLKGGGTVFGPKPRAYSIRLTKKMKDLARKSALSYKVKDDAIKLVEDFSFEEPKTSKMAKIISNLGLDGKKVLLLTPATDVTLYKSGRNIPKLNILEANKPSTYEILHADVIVICSSAVEVLQKSIIKNTEEVAA